jgi:hypothetical protein
MALDPTKTGYEKIVYKADAGDITFLAHELFMDDTTDFVETFNMVATAAGTERSQGNSGKEMSIFHVGTSKRAAVVADYGNVNDLEIYQQGNTTSTADIVFACDLMLEEVIARKDPNGAPSGIKYKAYRVNAI